MSNTATHEHTLSETVRKTREAAGMSQSELAGLAKMSQGYLSQIESGQVYSVGSKHLYNLANALGLTVYQLLGTKPVKLEDGLNPILVNVLRRLSTDRQALLAAFLDGLVD